MGPGSSSSTSITLRHLPLPGPGFDRLGASVSSRTGCARPAPVRARGSENSIPRDNCVSRPIGRKSAQKLAKILGRWERRLSAAQVGDVFPQKQIPEGVAYPVSDPSLNRMIRAVVQHVAALAHRAQITHAVVRRIVVQVRSREDDTGRSHPSRIDQVGPACSSPVCIAPGTANRIEPAAVRKAPDGCKVRALTVLAEASGAGEADMGADFWPIARIAGARGRANRHGAES